MKVMLNGPWTLTVVPERALKHWQEKHGRPWPDCAAALPAGDADWITVPATVPGNFELDLVRAGLLEDPFFGTNITTLRALEDRHLFYVTHFDTPAGVTASQNVFAPHASVALRFEGIDTHATISVNGTPIGHTENMLTETVWPLNPDGLKPTGNELMVHIFPTMLYAQYEWADLPPHVGAFKYNYASLRTRKAPSSFGWDILCRAVSGGLWRPVWLETTRDPHIQDAFIYTRDLRVGDDPARGDAALDVFYTFRTDSELTDTYEISVTGVCGDHRFFAREEVWHTCGHMIIRVPDACLWYPKNAGQPYLYDVTVSLWRRNVVVDQKVMRIGIRTVALERTSIIDEHGRGEFRFLVNHRPVFVMGTNWVPLDAFHSRDAERLPHALALLDDIGCNAVRCWGGNVYEDHAFFDFCDSHGILVWQDFAMGCAIYPQDDAMCDALADEVRSVVRKLRNHPSLCLWAGDNECDMFWMMCYPPMRNPQENRLTRRVIPEILREEDFTRPYLPSSPYVDEEAFRNGGQRTSEDHLWGPRDYFKGAFYRTAPCHFASEIGYHGCPSPASLEKFIPADQLWPIYDHGTAEDPFAGVPRPAWLAHQTSMELNRDNPFGYRIDLMTSQVRQMFKDTPADLDTYARMSQLSQAEAFKYFIERFRTAKWDKTGIIWWNLLDGWPQVSDAVVGYDFEPKLAYHFIKRAQSPVLMAFSDPDEASRASRIYTLHAINDTLADITLTYRVVDVSDPAAPVLRAGTVTVPAQGRAEADTLCLADRLDHVLSITWQDATGAANAHFIAEPQHLDYASYLSALRRCGIEV